LSMVTWTIDTLDARVDKELEALPNDMLASFTRTAERLESLGIAAERAPHVKSLGNGLFEIRMTGRDGIARAIYVHASRKRLVVVLVFVTKTQKTPPSIIRLALERAKGVKP
jgi:phage-related protein